MFMRDNIDTYLYNSCVVLLLWRDPQGALAPLRSGSAGVHSLHLAHPQVCKVTNKSQNIIPTVQSLEVHCNGIGQRHLFLLRVNLNALNSAGNPLD